MFRDLDKALDEVAKRSSTALTSIGEVKGLDKAKERVVSIINAINSEFAKMGKLGDTDLAKNFGDLTRRVNDATKAIKTYNSTIGSLSKGHAAAKSRANELG
jgi:Na+/phosphate symporter